MRACRWVGVVLCLAMAGCSLQAAPSEAPEGTSSLPMPGENEVVRRIMVPLHFPSSDNKRLVVEMREVDLMPGQSRAEIAIREMLKGPKTAGLNPVFWSNTELRRIEIARRVANVYFDETVEQMDDEQRAIVRAAIANSLAEIERVDYVNVYSENREPGGYRLRPIGPTSRLPGDLELYLTQVSKETDTPQEDFGNPGMDVRERRSITLYFADPTGRYLLPEVREIQYTSDQLVALIVEELAKGPREGQGLQGVIPTEMTLIDAPRVVVMADGRSTVYLNFESVEGVDYSLPFASLAYSITGFLPRVQYVVFKLDNIELADIPGIGAFEDGLVPREAFADYIGAEITLYFPNAERTSLVGIRRAVSQAQRSVARTCIEELARGPRPSDGDVVEVFGSGMGTEDILDVRVQRDVAWINLSARLYEQCRGMSPGEERMFIYAIVNTICEIEGVTRVQFLQDGQSMSNLTSNLDLRNPMLKNPGLTVK